MGCEAMISYLDTNIAIFLHSGDAARLTQRATAQIESADLLVSAMVILELEMLHEKGTFRYTASQIWSDLQSADRSVRLPASDGGRHEQCPGSEVESCTGRPYYRG